MEIAAAAVGALTPPAWIFANPEWDAKLLAGRSIIPDLPLFAAKADRAVGIFNNLHVPDIAGQPAMATAAGDWFRDIVRVIFGSLDDAGVRHVPEILALVGKKNSKTTYGAGLMLTALLMNEVPNGEFLFVAPTQEIADQAFGAARGMIEADPEGYLQKRFRIQEHKKTIIDRLNRAFVKVKTFDMKVMTGSKPIGVLIDELHIMGAMHYAARVIGQIRGALESKKNSFLLMISTQSDQPPAGAFRAELQYARAIRDGRVANGVRLLPILYEFPAKLQTDPAKPWADPKFWPSVMPNLGRSLHLDAMIAGGQAAQDKGEEEFRRWASQHLNIEIGLALHSDRWAGADYWLAQAARHITLPALLVNSEVAVASIDGGGLDDLLALNVTGREPVTRHWLSWSKTWVHRSVLKLRKDIAPRLEDFARAGELIIVDDMTEAFRDLAETVALVEAAGILPEKNSVGLDPMGVGLIVEALAEAGIDGERVVGVRQGWELNGAIKTLEVKLASGEYWHAGQEITAWAVGNAKVEPKGNAITITKQNAGTAKIDPLMAALIGAALMSKNPDGGRSVYDTMAESADAPAPEASASDGIDRAILDDPRHPRWQEMRERWESLYLAREEMEV